jgi:predicted DNA binding CopG/RHH family protein
MSVSTGDEEDTNKKDIVERIKEIKEENPDISNEEIAKMLADEKYRIADISRHLKVSGRSFKKISPNANADETVVEASGVKALEDFKKWAQEYTHLTISEISELGKGLVEMGVKEKAASQGMPLWDYVRNAIAFYNNYYDTVIELLKLRIINLDGQIDRDLLRVEEQA